ncbi:hypothetical protein LJR220_000649 [Bradyrhizobium sp. LjRoot220]|uniref:hypothetical protein n=1 Tax=Bradyrhizobium sp. LjRoot220 TaxID=3342284 RepID=UPI003ECD076B
MVHTKARVHTTFTQPHSDSPIEDFRWKHPASHFISQRDPGDETPRMTHIQPKYKSTSAMKSALIKRTDDWSYAVQRGRNSGNISTKREGLDEIGSRRFTDPKRFRLNLRPAQAPS